MAHLITTTKNFSYDKLSQELWDPKKKDPNLWEILQAFRGDYWQGGRGSLLPPSTGEHSSMINTLMERRFVYRNVIREVVERVSKAFYGKSPDWNIDGVENVDEIEAVLSEVWTQKNFSSILSQAFESRLVSGKGGIRIYLPNKFKRRYETLVPVNPETSDDLLDTGVGNTNLQGTESPEAIPVVQFPDIIEAIRAIEIEAIEPENGTLLKEDGEQFSIVRYSVRKDWDTDRATNVIEFTFVDQDLITWLGLIEETQGGNLVDFIRSTGLRLNDKTTYFEITGTPYVERSLYRNNQLLNLALTCAGFSLVDNGFSEMILTNVDLETEKIPDEDSDTGYRETPKRLKRGGGVVNNLIGITQVNEETGQETVTSPGVHFRTPSGMEVYNQGKDLAYRACLEEAQQLYALISGDAAVSGESRIQAMSDFYLKLTKYKSEVDSLGSWLLTTILRFAAELSGAEPSAIATYDSKIFIADLSQSEKNLVFKMLDEGLISRETAQALLGVEDPIVESDRILAESDLPFSEVPDSVKNERLALVASATGILPQLISLQLLGITQEQAQGIMEVQNEEQAVQFEQMRAQEESLGANQ